MRPSRLSALLHASGHPTRIQRRPPSVPILSRPPVLRSMSGIPLLGAALGSSSSRSKMSYPDQRSDDEWRAVLNQGTSAPPYPSLPSPKQRQRPSVDAERRPPGLPQSSSAFSGKRARSRPGPAITTSTTRPKASTRAPGATRRSTRRPTSSSRAVAGLRTLTACRAPSRGTRTARWACRGPRLSAPTAAGTWATSSRGRASGRRRTSGTASTASA